jgi:hypothetical protein
MARRMARVLRSVTAARMMLRSIVTYSGLAWRNSSRPELPVPMSSRAILKPWLRSCLRLSMTDAAFGHLDDDTVGSDAGGACHLPATREANHLRVSGRATVLSPETRCVMGSSRIAVPETPTTGSKRAANV